MPHSVAHTSTAEDASATRAEDVCAPAEAGSSARRACMVAYTFYESDNRVRRYAETLLRKGYEVDVLALARQKSGRGVHFVNGVRVFSLQHRAVNEKSRFVILLKLLLFFVRSFWKLTREQVRKRYDIIHVHSIPDFEVFAALYPKISGSKVILDIHDIVPEYYASKFGISRASATFRVLIGIEKISSAFSDHVIIANHIWQDRLEARSVGRAKLTTILNFPDTQIFRRCGRTRNYDKFIVVYPGSLNYHQGLDLAIRGFAAIMEQVPQAEFHIYGAGEQLSALTELIRTLGADQRILYKGARTLDEVASIMENADLGIVPKRSVGFGNEAFSTKILEFMAMGIPVLVPDTTVDSFYFDSSVVRFFRAGDEASLSENMLHLIAHPSERERLVRNADQFVKRYVWSNNEDVYLGIVDSLLKSSELV